MESSMVQKPSKERNPKLFIPPPYCRKVDLGKGEDELLQQVPSLKLTVSNPSKILHLCEKLTDESSKALEAKINTYLMTEGECKSAFLVHLSCSNEEAFVQTVGIHELETAQHFPLSQDIIKGLVLFENKSLKCDYELDSKIVTIFNEVYSKHNQIVSIPILNKNYKYYPCSVRNVHPALLVCFVDSSKDEDFLIKLAGELFTYCQAVLLNTLTGEEEAQRKRQCQSLLSINRKLFSYLEDMNYLFKEIVHEAKNLTNARKCSLFLLDPDQVHYVTKIFDTPSTTKIDTVVRSVKDQTIPGYVASTGKVLNIRNPHDSFVCLDDELDGFVETEIKNVLCFPIRDEDNVTGVAQLLNKRWTNFNHSDEEAVEMFGILCGLSIKHAAIYKQMKEARIRSQISNQLMLHHVTVDNDEVTKRVTCPLIHKYPKFDQFDFSPKEILPKETVCLVLLMFEDLGFLTTFSIKKDILTRFVLMVQKCYSDSPYHNWRHAFSATHFVYLCLKKLELVKNGYISNLEALACLISCLCHDVDHRGVNNLLQRERHDAIASLYSSQGSVMERYHLSQTLSILNTEGCNFLERLDRQRYSLCLDLIKDLILATDLAVHLKFYQKQYNMAKESYGRDNPEHRYVLCSLLMTCADFADQIKNWPDTKRVVQGIYKEFLIRNTIQINLEAETETLIDEDEIDVPDLQIGLLKNICLPAYKILGSLFKPAKELVYKVKQNIMYWEASRRLFDKARDEGRSCMDVLGSEGLVKKVEMVMGLLEEQKL